MRPQLTETIRYFIVILFGLSLDIAIGFTVHEVFAAPLIFGAAVGFLAGVAFNYVLIERWVFRTGQMSWVRLGKTCVAAQGVLIFRLVSVWALSRILGSSPQASLASLALASILSFSLNYLLMRLILRRQ